jgi:4Fe-4S ferredoxin
MSDAKDDCKRSPGEVAPVIDLARCEGKSDCLRVCPYGVFEVRVATGTERKGLGLLAQLKSAAHGHKKAFAINPDQCHACGLCVQACPEKAIRLKAVAA